MADHAGIRRARSHVLQDRSLVERLAHCALEPVVGHRRTEPGLVDELLHPALQSEPIDHQAGDPVEAVRSLTGSSGVQVLADPVQGDAGATMRAALAADGRHILCGHAGGLVDHGAELYLSNHTLVGATLGGYGRARMREIHAETNDALSAMLANGTYRPTVHRVVDFDQVPEAVTAIAERHTIGRTVVRMPT